MKVIFKSFFLIIAIFLLQEGLFHQTANAQPTEISHTNNADIVPAKTLETLRAIYEGNEFNAKSFRANWQRDGSGYLMLETEPSTGQQVLARYDAATGKRSVLINPANLSLTEFTGGDIGIDNYQFSSNGNQVLLQLSNKGRNDNNSGDWLLELKSGKIQKVVAGSNNSISPDGKKILFSKEGDLFVYNLKAETTIPVTTDAVADAVSNGEAIWSPDGNRIAFVQSDASDVRLRSALIPGDPSYPEVRETRFARVGGIISKLRVGVVDAEGKETRWLSISVPAEGYYLGQMNWAGSSNKLLIEKLNRFRTKREFLIADVNTGTITSIYEESDPDWVIASYNTNSGLEWIRDFNSFLVLTEKDGWRHAYLCSRNTKDQKILTPGEFDIIERIKVDEAGGWFYYYASPDNGTQKYLYRVRLDGKGKPERLSPMDQPGTHDYSFSPDAKWAFHTYSNSNTPPVTELVKFPENRTIRVLEDNKALKEKMSSMNVQPKELFQVDIGNGIVIDGWMIKPHDFDPSKKYPVFVYVYGEPHGQTVLDSWGHAYTDFHRAIADLGYLVISMDNRGTPCPKGAAWRRAVSGSLGPLSTEEQAAGLKELGRTRSWVDLSRVGIWGWSGGGSNTLNSMFRKPDVYNVGIAVAPKPQPWLYNAWFQEIYMKTPEVNPEGYQESAPINFAEGLKGDLLIIHGSGETNTHVQITEGLVDRLIELGKPFDYMNYPNRDHGIREGKGTTLHMRTLIVRYLLQHLHAGPLTRSGIDEIK